MELILECHLSGREKDFSCVCYVPFVVDVSCEDDVGTGEVGRSFGVSVGSFGYRRGSSRTMKDLHQDLVFVVPTVEDEPNPIPVPHTVDIILICRMVQSLTQSVDQVRLFVRADLGVSSKMCLSVLPGNEVPG